MPPSWWSSQSRSHQWCPPRRTQTPSSSGAEACVSQNRAGILSHRDPARCSSRKPPDRSLRTGMWPAPRPGPLSSAAAPCRAVNGIVGSAWIQCFGSGPPCSNTSFCNSSETKGTLFKSRSGGRHRTANTTPPHRPSQGAPVKMALMGTSGYYLPSFDNSLSASEPFFRRNFSVISMNMNANLDPHGSFKHPRPNTNVRTSQTVSRRGLTLAS